MTTITAQDWVFSDVGSGIKPNIEIAPDGRIYIASMRESTTDGYVKLISVNNGVGMEELVSEGYFYGPLDLAVNNSGVPIIAYHDHLTNGGDLAVARKMNNAWLIEFVESTGHDGWDGTMALDASGNIHTVSTDGSGGVEYAFYDGQSWTVSTITDVNAMYQFGTDIGIDQNGEVHVSYFVDEQSTLYYAHRTNNEWVIDTLGTNAIFPSLELIDGEVFIAYYQGSRTGSVWEQFGQIRVAHKRNGTWTHTTLDNVDQLNTGSMTGARAIVDLKKDRNNRLHIAYSNRKLVKYGQRVNANWQIDTVLNLSLQNQNLGQQTSLAIDSTGLAHIAVYRRLANPSNGTIMYAKSPGFIIDTTQEPSLILTCPADTSFFCDVIPTPELAGMPMVDSTVTLSFSDLTSPGCHGMFVIVRQWIAVRGELTDTCVQQISLQPNSFDALSIRDTVVVELPCDFGLNDIPQDSFPVACGLSLDSVSYGAIAFGCDISQVIRSFHLSSACEDSNLRIDQVVSITHPQDFNVDDFTITADNGTGNGSIQLEIESCTGDFSISWSNGDSTLTANNLVAGEYNVVVTSPRGCSDSINFVIQLVRDDFGLICPPDTTINCNVLISPNFTGLPIVRGYNLVTFVDSFLQECPADIIIQRTWIASSDSLSVPADTCVQLITVEVDLFEDFMTIDTLEFDGICLTSLNDPILEGLNLPCNIGIDSITFEFIENTCARKVWEASWTFGDQCRDTSIMIRSILISNNPAVVDFASVIIEPDTGSASGRIILDPACVDGQLNYLWSNGGMDTAIVGLTAGIYNLVVTNDLLCTDTFSFEVSGMMDTMQLSIICAPNSTVGCDIDVANLPFQSPILIGYDSLSFEDTVLQDCPTDQLFRRTYIAYRDGQARDSCTQTITRKAPDITAAILTDFPDTLRIATVGCVEDIRAIAQTELTLGCGFTMISDSISFDSITCSAVIGTRTVSVSSQCLDTILTISQTILATDLIIAKLDSTRIVGDTGSNTGSIEVFLTGCIASDSLSFVWSNDQLGSRIDSLASGEYVVTVRAASGCETIYSFFVPQIDTTFRSLDCPIDVTLMCGTEISLELTGEANIVGYDSLRYEDIVVSACPANEVTRRIWFAYLGGNKADSCEQIITILGADIAAIQVRALVTLSNVCVEDIPSIPVDNIPLNCDITLDSIYFANDTINCNQTELRRIYQFSSACRDTSFTREQTIQLNNIRVSRFVAATILPDDGTRTGSISVSLTSCSDSLSYVWSNGDVGIMADSLRAGRYTVTVRNQTGCSDSYDFTVPLDPDAILDTMLRMTVVGRDSATLRIDSVYLVMNDNSTMPISFSQTDSVINLMSNIKVSDVNEVCVIRNESPVIDLTVSDIVRGQLTILGLARSCAEDLLAGDVNLSGNISGADLVLMRNVLLGNRQSYPSNISWAFVNRDVFPVRPQVSAAVCAPLTVENKLSALVHLQGIKLGDYRCTE